MNHPKISIVTPSYNQGNYLEQTICSIITQNYPNLEYIVVDGGSTDNSLAIIKKYEKHLAYWVSEKDKGQSDAINKGLEKCTGELFNWINSDDLLEENALFKIAAAYQQNPEKKIFCFRLNYLDRIQKQLFDKRNHPNDPLQCFCDPVIAQPSTFFSLEHIKKTTGLSVQLHYSMDYELWLKCMFLFGTESIVVNEEIIASFRVHQDAKTAKGNTNFINEMASVLYSLSQQVELKNCSRILGSVFQIKKEYEFLIPVDKINTRIVEQMVIYFLLKWKRKVFSKKDFFDAKLLLKEIPFQICDLSAKEQGWLDELRENTTAASWLKFRVRRKIRHIFSKTEV